MKKLKRLIVALLALIASFGITNAVFAEGAATNTTGSITIKNTTKNKIYEVYKIFDLTYNKVYETNAETGEIVKDKDGNPIVKKTNVAYTIDSDWTAFFNGVGSKYIIDDQSEDWTDQLNQITITSVKDGNEVKETKYIYITESNVAEFTQDAFDYAAKNKLKADKTGTGTGEDITIEGLALGYYLVYPQGAADIKDTYASICSITSTLPDAEVNIKATYPTINKTVNKPSFNVGEYASFKITGKVPDTTGYADGTYVYTIKDTWTKGLALDETKVDFTVKIDGTEIDVNPVYNQSKNGFDLTIDVTKYQDKIGKTIEVTYKLKVTKDAINSTTTNNEAYLVYSNNPKTGETGESEKIKEYVYSAKIQVIKVDGENQDIKLEGAVFVLKNSNGEYYQATTTTTQEGEILTLVTWGDKSSATELTTDENGILTFEGVVDGRYELEEITPPEGYNKLVETVPVTVVREVKEGVVTLITKNVANYTGTALPSTGGLGTTLFITIGSLLAVASVIILITNKRISKEF